MDREEYTKALTRLDEIWEARPGDLNWDERLSLVEQIVSYEDANFYIPPPDPIDAIRFRREQEGFIEEPVEEN